MSEITMSVENYDVRVWIDALRDPEAFERILNFVSTGISFRGRKLDHLDFLPMYRRRQVSMSKHAESQEGQSYRLREEHPANIRRNEGKGISNTSNDDIFEPSSLLYEQILIFMFGEKAVLDESERQFDNCRLVSQPLKCITIVS
jgi:hypothetical protein